MLNNGHVKKSIISVILIIVSISFIRSTIVIYHSNKRLINLKEEVKLLENKKISLEESIAYKQSNDYVEEIARNELNLVQPNEEVYVVKGLDAEESKSVLSTVSSRDVDVQAYTDSVWYMWYRLFANN